MKWLLSSERATSSRTDLGTEFGVLAAAWRLLMKGEVGGEHCRHWQEKI